MWVKPREARRGLESSLDCWGKRGGSHARCYPMFPFLGTCSALGISSAERIRLKFLWEQGIPAGHDDDFCPSSGIPLEGHFSRGFPLRFAEREGVQVAFIFLLVVLTRVQRELETAYKTGFVRGFRMMVSPVGGVVGVTVVCKLTDSSFSKNGRDVGCLHPDGTRHRRHVTGNLPLWETVVVCSPPHPGASKPKPLH